MRSGRVLALVLVALLFGASPSIAGCAIRNDDALYVFAASSTADVMHELEREFEAQHPDVNVIVNLGASSSLRQQIIEGAPADVFVSADVANMTVVEAAVPDAEVQLFATNQLALAVPLANPGEVASVGDLAEEKLFVGLCEPEVPCGRLAARLLDEAGVTASLDTHEADVRSLVTKLQAGELDVGIVYLSDIVGSSDLATVQLPDGIDIATSYPIALLNNDPNALEFVEFSQSAAAVEVLQRYGFGS